jgi:hypothetical protein
MITSTDGYFGTLIREYRTHPVYGDGFYSYLSAKVGDRWLHVEKWDEDENSAVSEDDLRSVLRRAITNDPSSLLRLV